MQAMQTLQRNYDYALPVNNNSFDELQSYYIEKLEKIGLEQAIINAFPFMDSQDIGEALKACSVDFDALFNAIAYEIAKKKLRG